MLPPTNSRRMELWGTHRDRHVLPVAKRVWALIPGVKHHGAQEAPPRDGGRRGGAPPIPVREFRREEPLDRGRGTASTIKGSLT